MLHEIIRHTSASRDEAYFWARNSSAGLDLMIVRNGRRLGFEVKLTRSPKVTPSMRSAQAALGLDHLYVVRHGEGEAWPLAQGISAAPLNALYSVGLTA